MDVSNILRPDDLPFEVTYDLRKDINRLIDALERDDDFIALYLDEVESSARQVSEENDDWIRKYYVQGGWRKSHG